jgi:predicted dithiol-disulfide oxidoreductase (DUF899 family)
VKVWSSRLSSLPARLDRRAPEAVVRRDYNISHGKAHLINLFGGRRQLVLYQRCVARDDSTSRSQEKQADRRQPAGANLFVARF